MSTGRTLNDRKAQGMGCSSPKNTTKRWSDITLVNQILYSALDLSGAVHLLVEGRGTLRNLSFLDHHYLLTKLSLFMLYSLHFIVLVVMKSLMPLIRFTLAS